VPHPVPARGDRPARCWWFGLGPAGYTPGAPPLLKRRPHGWSGNRRAEDRAAGPNRWPGRAPLTAAAPAFEPLARCEFDRRAARSARVAGRISAAWPSTASRCGWDKNNLKLIRLLLAPARRNSAMVGGRAVRRHAWMSTDRHGASGSITSRCCHGRRASPDHARCGPTAWRRGVRAGGPDFPDGAAAHPARPKADSIAQPAAAGCRVVVIRRGPDRDPTRATESLALFTGRGRSKKFPAPVSRNSPGGIGEDAIREPLGTDLDRENRGGISWRTARAPPVRPGARNWPGASSAPRAIAGRLLRRNGAAPPSCTPGAA